MIKQYIIIWKDREGSIHRSEHFHKHGLGYLLFFYYSKWSPMWIDDKGNMHIEKPEREILYIFKQK